MANENIWSDVHGRINTSNSSGVYYNYYLDTAGADRATLNAPGYKAGLSVMAASRRRVLVTLHSVAMPAPGISVSAGEVQKAKDTLVDQVNALWNQNRLKMNVLVLDATGHRPTGDHRALDVEFRIRWASTGGDYILYVYPTPNDLPALPGRPDRPPFVSPGSGRIEMHIAATTPAWTYSHEFGHCIGLPDEYNHPGVRYFKPEGATDQLLQRPGAFIPANRQGNVNAGVRDPDLRTTMSTNPNTNLMPRHL